MTEWLNCSDWLALKQYWIHKYLTEWLSRSVLSLSQSTRYRTPPPATNSVQLLWISTLSTISTISTYLHPDILSPVPQPQHGNYEDLHTVARAQASVTLATTIWCFMITVPQQSTASCSNSNSSNTVWGGNTVTTTWLGRYVRYSEVLWGIVRYATTLEPGPGQSWV